MTSIRNQSVQSHLHGIQESSHKRSKIAAKLQIRLLGYLIAIAGLSFAGKALAALTLDWVRQIGSTSNFDTATDVAVDSSNNVYITGHNSPGAPPLGNNAGFYDGFVAKYNNSGTLQWIRKIATSDNDFVNGVTTDASGNVYITGETKGNITSAYSDALVW
jgi:Beta-propeller repeat